MKNNTTQRKFTEKKKKIMYEHKHTQVRDITGLSIHFEVSASERKKDKKTTVF